MVGGAGDPPPPLNGGEFLLQLLKNPPQHPRSHSQPPPPQPSQSLPHDPAVAAVGSIPFPPTSFSSHGSDYGPLLFPPHNYFNQGLGLGFPQNPNPNQNHNLINQNSNWPMNLLQNQHQINNQGVNDDLSKLGLIYNNNNNLQQLQLQQQDRHNKLVFGTLNSEIQSSKMSKNGNLDYNLDRELGMGNSRVNGSEHMQVSSLSFGNYVSNEAASMQQVRRMPPPGFSSNSRAVGKRNSEPNLSSGERLHFGEQRGVINQFDDPGPSRGSHLHSVSLTDVEESMMALHAMDEKRSRNNGVDTADLDDLEEQVDNLLLEDGTDEKSDVKKGPKSRDKVEFYANL